MAIKLDQRVLKTLPLEEENTRTRYADSVVQGLHIEVLPASTPGGELRKVWRLRYRTTSGERKWLTLGTWPATSVDAARSEARRIIGDVEKGADPAAERTALKKAATIDDLWDQFKELHGPHLRATTLKGYKDQYRAHIKGAFGSTKIQNLTREAIARWHRKISETAPTSANYALRVLSTLLARAEEWGHIPLGTNPAKLVKQNKAKKKHRPLTTEESHLVGSTITQLAKEGTISAQVAAALRLLLLTGCRRGEIANLKWVEVNLESGCIVLGEDEASDHKTKDHLGTKTIFLGPAALQILEELAGQRLSAYVFPGSREGLPMSPMTINRGWDLVRKKAGIPDARLHDLRHTVGAMAGATLPAFMVQTILGHKQPSTTSRYAKPIDSATEQAVHNLQRQIAANLGL